MFDIPAFTSPYGGTGDKGTSILKAHQDTLQREIRRYIDM